MNKVVKKLQIIKWCCLHTESNCGPIDYSARVQTVKHEDYLISYDLIKKFYEKTDCQILVNTSLNIRGEPIISTVEDALNCFMSTNLDVSVINNFILKKNIGMLF